MKKVWRNDPTQKGEQERRLNQIWDHVTRILKTGLDACSIKRTTTNKMAAFPQSGGGNKMVVILVEAEWLQLQWRVGAREALLSSSIS